MEMRNNEKYRVSLSVDENWVKRFDLTFDAADEQDAEAQAMVEVKMNLGDYITAYADEEGDEGKHTKSQRVKLFTLFMKQK